MITGPWINGSAVVIGGMAGAIISARLPDRLRVSMPLIFGAASLCMGIVLVTSVSHMPVMVLSVLLGTLLGELCYLEKGIGYLGEKARGLVALVVRENPRRRGLPRRVSAKIRGDHCAFLRQRHRYFWGHA